MEGWEGQGGFDQHMGSILVVFVRIAVAYRYSSRVRRGINNDNRGPRNRVRASRKENEKKQSHWTQARRQNSILLSPAQLQRQHKALGPSLLRLGVTTARRNRSV